MTMFARFETASRRLIDWSSLPFTLPPGPGESEKQFLDGTVLPGRRNLTRLTSDLSGLIIDDTLKSSEEVAEESRSNAAQVILGNNQGQGVGVMPLPKLSEIVIAIGQRLGIIDENGDVI